MSLHIVILAAGAGKRMFSKVPKVLHPLAGKPLLSHVLACAESLHPEMIHVIYGHEGEKLRQCFKQANLNWIFQNEPAGTGHAVLQAIPSIPEDAQVLVLSADVPLIQKNTLESLIEKAGAGESPKLALLLATLDNPFGLGRIVRNAENQVLSIVEERDASPGEKLIKEIYSGICCLPRSLLARWLPQLNNHNAQKEYYLTDIIAMSIAEKIPVVSISAQDPVEIQGVNNRLQLQQLERAFQKNQAFQFMLNGVTIADASRIDIRGELTCGRDVTIDVNCVFSGKVVLGDDCIIEANCVLNQVTLEAGCHIHANSVLDNCHIGPQCHIGPFARLRPGTRLGAHCKIGNFVETKNAIFEEDSKANHLTYLGDCTIGKHSNVGAGTITCNYDGANKHHTHIGDGVFIGSGTQLVAPVSIGDNATIGAGSTIRKDAPANELTLTKREQVSIAAWKKPIKKSEPQS